MLLPQAACLSYTRQKSRARRDSPTPEQREGGVFLIPPLPQQAGAFRVSVKEMRLLLGMGGFGG